MRSRGQEQSLQTLDNYNQSRVLMFLNDQETATDLLHYEAIARTVVRFAEQARKGGPALILKGRKAVKSKSVAAMIAADREFHDFIYELAQNPLIAPAMQSQWTSTQRVMGEVLMRDEKPRDIWDQHEAMLAAVAEGNAALAEKLARQHVMQAANFMISRLRSQRKAAPANAKAEVAP